MEDLDAVTSWFSSSNFTSKESGTEIKKDSSYREGVEKAVASKGILAGAQICPKLPFKNRKGAEISLTPVIVDFRRLLQCKSGLSCSIEVIPGVSRL